jgi:hypothetical protein
MKFRRIHKESIIKKHNMDKAQKRAAFVEKYGMFAEKVGFSPMNGRIFA